VDWSKADTVAGRQRAGRHRWACAFTTAIHRKGSHREKRKAWINIFYEALRFRTTSPADLRFTTAIHRKGRRREKRKAWINIFYEALRFRTNSLAGFSWYVRKNGVD